MGLTTDELNGIVAQWEEWTAGAGFALSIEVKAGMVDAVMVDSVTAALEVAGRIQPGSLHCQVQIRRGDALVFNQPVPHDAAMLRASVTTLARFIATSTERQADQQSAGD